MEKIRIIDRLMSGIYAAGAILATLIIPVIFAYVYKATHVSEISKWPMDIEVFIPIAIGVTIASVIAGFLLGTSRICTMFYYLWAIQKPGNYKITLSLWGAVMIVSVLSIWVYRNVL